MSEARENPYIPVALEIRPNDQGGGEPESDKCPNRISSDFGEIETKVNSLQTQIGDMANVLEKLTRTLDNVVKINHDISDGRCDVSEFRTVDNWSERDAHDNPSDAAQSHFCPPYNALGADRHKPEYSDQFHSVLPHSRGHPVHVVNQNHMTDGRVGQITLHSSKWFVV